MILPENTICVVLVADLVEDVVEFVDSINHLGDIGFLQSGDRRVTKCVGEEPLPGTRWVSVDAVYVVPRLERMRRPRRRVVDGECLKQHDRDINASLTGGDASIAPSI